MKLTVYFIGTVTLTCLLTAAHCWADESIEKLETCYQAQAVAEQTDNANGTKTTEVLSDDQVAARCNQKVLQEAKSQKNADQVLKLADLIGRKSNWASAAPVYVLAAKLDQKKTCSGENTIQSMKDGVAQPSDFPPLKDAKRLMEACWPDDKTVLSHAVTQSQDSYTKLSVCPFLTAHKVALTSLAKSVCEGVNP